MDEAEAARWLHISRLVVAPSGSYGPDTPVDSIPAETLAQFGRDLISRYFAHYEAACVYDEYGHIRRGSDIGCRSLIYCATFHPEAVFNYAEMAKRAGVTRAYLSKISKQMAHKLGADVPVFHAGGHDLRGAAKVNHEEKMRRENARLAREIARIKAARARARK